MKWPLVWRSTLDTIRQVADDTEHRLLAQFADLRTATDTIVAGVNRELSHRTERNAVSLAAAHRETERVEEFAKAEHVRLEREAIVLGSQVASLERENALKQATIERLLEQAAKSEPVEQQRSKLTQTIRDLARQPDGTIDRRLLSHFRGEANKLQRDGKTVDEIITDISTWQTTERGEDALTVEAMIAKFTAV